MSISVRRVLTPGAGALLRARRVAGRESARGAIAGLCGPSAGRLGPMPHLRHSGPVSLIPDRVARMAHLGQAAGTDHVARPDYLPGGRGERLFDIGRRRPVAACMVEDAPERTALAVRPADFVPAARAAAAGKMGEWPAARSGGVRARGFSGRPGLSRSEIRTSLSDLHMTALSDYLYT
jgi:hypothetical protein